MQMRPSQAGQNSQMALVFDHVELKGGKTMPIHLQIQSISPAAGAASSSGPSAAVGATNGSQAGGATKPSTSGAAYSAYSATQAPGGSPGDASAANGGPAPGTVVAKVEFRGENAEAATQTAYSSRCGQVIPFDVGT
jgi:hypothetical protein